MSKKPKGELIEYTSDVFIADGYVGNAATLF